MDNFSNFPIEYHYINIFIVLIIKSVSIFGDRDGFDIIYQFYISLLLHKPILLEHTLDTMLYVIISMCERLYTVHYVQCTVYTVYSVQLHRS